MHAITCIDLPGDTPGRFPYSQAVASEGLLFVAGQLAGDEPAWSGPGGDIAAETRMALQRIERILVAAGLGFEDVLRVGVFMTNLDDFASMNTVYRTFFVGPHLPARTCVGVARLLDGHVICRSLGLTAPELGVTFENLLAKGQVLGFAGLWYAVPTFDALAQEFEAALLQVHHEMPSQPTVPPEAVVRKAGLKWSGKPLDRILGHLSQTGRIERHGDGIRKPSFSTQLKPRQRALLTRVIECLSSEPVNTPHAHDIARLLGIPHPAVEEIMRIGIEIGEIIVLTEAVYYTPAQIQDLKARLVELADGKPFSSNDMRDAFGTSRKYMLPILEYFDRIGFTERDGDRRTIVSEP